MVTEDLINQKIIEKDDLVLSTLFKNIHPIQKIDSSKLINPFNILLSLQKVENKNLNHYKLMIKESQSLEKKYFFVKRRILSNIRYSNENIEIIEYLSDLFNQDYCRPIIANLMLLMYFRIKNFKSMINLVDVISELDIFGLKDQDTKKFESHDEEKNKFKLHDQEKNKLHDQDKIKFKLHDQDQDQYQEKIKKWKKKDKKIFNDDEKNNISSSWDRKKFTKKSKRNFPGKKNYHKEIDYHKESEFFYDLNTKIFPKDKLIFLFFKGISEFKNKNYKESEIIFKKILKFNLIKNKINFLNKILEIYSIITFLNDTFYFSKNNNLKFIMSNINKCNLKIINNFNDQIFGIDFFLKCIRNLIFFCYQHFSVDHKLNLNFIKAAFFINDIKSDNYIFYVFQIVNKGFIKGYVSLNKEVLVFSKIDPFPGLKVFD